MTLKDIAEECGVSIMTVSNVINGKHSKVSEKTIKKVNESVKRNHYVPNLSARALSGSSSHIILIVLPYSDNIDELSISNPYLAELLSVIERELMLNGYFTMLRTVYNPEDVTVIYKTWHVDGAIFLFPLFDRSVPKIEGYQDKNFILMDSYASIDNVLCIRFNDYQGCYLSTTHLIEHGHTNIAFVAEHEGNRLLTHRRNGYLDALKDHGIEFNPHNSIDVPPDYYHGIEIGHTIKKTHPDITAIVTTSDMCALGIIQGGREEGIAFPDDLSIVGYDDLPICNFSQPKLTSINQNIKLKGETAVQLMLAKISGKKVSSEPVITDVHIIERTSVKTINN